MARIKSLAQQIAELDDPVPKDYDPEEDGGAQISEGSEPEESEDDLAGTEHYEKAGKSKLRKPQEVQLGPKYAGTRVSRNTLEEQSDDEGFSDGYEDEDNPVDEEGFADPDTVDMDIDDEDGDIDSDEALGESDEEKFKDFAFRGSGKPRDSTIDGFRSKRKTAADFMSDSEVEEEQSDEADLDDEEDLEQISMESEGEDDDFGDDGEDGSGRHNGMDEELSQSSEDEEIDDEESEDEDEDGGEEDSEQTERAELRKIMNEEQKSVVATISQAAKADAQKGNAVKQQRKAFDSLLNVRIRLQKALVATNSMAASDEKESQEAADTEPYQAAEEAAIKLLNSLNAMRHELETAGGSKSSKKRKHTIDVDTPSSAIWQSIQSSEILAVQQRQATLEKWSAKVRGATATPVSRKLNQTTAQTIIQVLEDQLSNSERLVKRTKMPRSCAPVQAKSKITEDANIYDDADFYQLLLKELVDQRMVDSNSSANTHGDGGRPIAQWTAVKEAKTKKNVDTKASKGRKMKFTVHEKLQNFMAPEDRGDWEQDRIDRFYSTLLGQKMNLGEEDAEASEEEDEEEPLADEGLAFFRS